MQGRNPDVQLVCGALVPKSASLSAGFHIVFTKHLLLLTELGTKNHPSDKSLENFSPQLLFLSFLWVRSHRLHPHPPKKRPLGAGRLRNGCTGRTPKVSRQRFSCFPHIVSETIVWPALWLSGTTGWKRVSLGEVAQLYMQVWGPGSDTQNKHRSLWSQDWLRK